MHIVPVFLDDTGVAHVLESFVAENTDDAHLKIFELLTQTAHATWSFVVGIESARRPAPFVDRASLNGWTPTEAQRQKLLAKLEAEELRRIRGIRPN